MWHFPFAANMILNVSNLVNHGMHLCTSLQSCARVSYPAQTVEQVIFTREVGSLMLEIVSLGSCLVVTFNLLWSLLLYLYFNKLNKFVDQRSLLPAVGDSEVCL